MMDNSRQRILSRLNREEKPFPGVTGPEDYLPMVPIADQSPSALMALFIDSAEKAGCVVRGPGSADEALATVLEIVEGQTAVSCWQPSLIPLPGLEADLTRANTACVGLDAAAEVGITGVDAALAATGSLVLKSGPGQNRAASLLPPVHIAAVKASQIVADFESWWARQRSLGLDKLRESSNIAIITGPSRTADIAMQLVMGMHGPRELWIVLVDDLDS